MTTAQAVHVEEKQPATYERMVQKGTAVASLLFGLLLLVAAAYRLVGEEVVYENGWLNSNDIHITNFLWLAWLAGILAMLGLAQLVKDAKPRAAFVGTILVFIGAVMQMAAHKGEARTADLREAGIEIYWTITSGKTPAFFEALGATVLLWVIGLLILAIAVWRTGALPKWTALLAIIGTVAYAVAQPVSGAAGIASMFAAAICFIIVFTISGLRLWRGETAEQTSDR